MKCPNCGFNSFDYLDECRKCKLPLNPSTEYKSLYKKAVKLDRQEPKGEEVNAHSLGETEAFQAPNTPPGQDEEPDVPAYYKRWEHPEIDSEDIAGAYEPEVSTEPEPEIETGAPSQEPVLYSESKEDQTETNFTEDSVPSGEEVSYSIAGLKLRAAAFIIDLTVVGLITYITIEAGFSFMNEEDINPGELERVFIPIYALLFFLASTYFIFLHYYAGRTLGKMVLGIRVISADGTELGLWESFMRWVGYYISAVLLFAGFIWSVFDPDSQAWHDKIAGTYVVVG